MKITISELKEMIRDIVKEELATVEAPVEEAPVEEAAEEVEVKEEEPVEEAICEAADDLGDIIRYTAEEYADLLDIDVADLNVNDDDLKAVAVYESPAEEVGYFGVEFADGSFAVYGEGEDKFVDSKEEMLKYLDGSIIEDDEE